MNRPPPKTEVAKLRQASGMPQKELADKLGCTREHLAMVEVGMRESKSLVVRARAILSGS